MSDKKTDKIREIIDPIHDVSPELRASIDQFSDQLANMFQSVPWNQRETVFSVLMGEVIIRYQTLNNVPAAQQGAFLAMTTRRGADDDIRGAASDLSSGEFKHNRSALGALQTLEKMMRDMMRGAGLAILHSVTSDTEYGIRPPLNFEGEVLSDAEGAKRVAELIRNGENPSKFMSTASILHFATADCAACEGAEGCSDRALMPLLQDAIRDFYYKEAKASPDPEHLQGFLKRFPNYAEPSADENH